MFIDTTDHINSIIERINSSWNCDTDAQINKYTSIQKRALIITGRKHTDEAKKKMSETRKDIIRESKTSNINASYRYEAHRRNQT